jgi:hypothetical protein
VARGRVVRGVEDRAVKERVRHLQFLLRSSPALPSIIASRSRTFAKRSGSSWREVRPPACARKRRGILPLWRDRSYDFRPESAVRPSLSAPPAMLPRCWATRSPPVRTVALEPGSQKSHRSDRSCGGILTASLGTGRDPQFCRTSAIRHGPAPSRPVLVRWPQEKSPLSFAR